MDRRCGNFFFLPPVSDILPLVQTKTITIMKLYTKILIIVACALVFAGTVRAGESVAGKWTAQFDSQIGMQKYTYDFKVNGDKLTGTATGERQMDTNTVAITDGKINKDEVSFVEPLKFQDQEIQIKYEGKVAGNEIKFTRHVGDFATEELVAHRVKAGDMKSETKPEGKSRTETDTNSASAKP